MDARDFEALLTRIKCFLASNSSLQLCSNRNGSFPPSVHFLFPPTSSIRTSTLYLKSNSQSQYKVTPSLSKTNPIRKHSDSHTPEPYQRSYRRLISLAPSTFTPSSALGSLYQTGVLAVSIFLY